LAYFERACELKYQLACFNLLDQNLLGRGDPQELDLRLLLREGGQNLMNAPLSELHARACEHNWSFACSMAQVSNGIRL